MAQGVTKEEGGNAPVVSEGGGGGGGEMDSSKCAQEISHLLRCI